MKVLLFVGLSCLVLLVSEWLSIFTVNEGWDIFHLMDTGQRFLEGELAWTVEYVDKLLITQFLFILPAFFGTLKIWFLISAIFVIFGSYACFVLVDDILSTNLNISIQNRKISAIIGAISTLYLFSLLPGQLMHINAVSASSAVISLALLLKSSFKFLDRKISFLPFFLSAIFASISIGVRPYYLIALIISAILLLLTIFKNSLGIKRTSFISFFWVSLIGIFGLITNMVPYIIIGNMEAFFAGISMLSQVPPPSTIIKILYNLMIDIFKQPALIILIIVLSSSSPIFAIITFARSRQSIIAFDKMTYSIIVLTLILPLLLLLTILNRHYWNHYLQMFAPFWGMGLGFFFAISISNFIKKPLKDSTIISAVAISLVFFTIIPNFTYNLRNIYDSTIENKLKSNVGDIRITEITKVLRSLSEEKRDFLFLDDMRPHFFLKESRHGFPQAANTRHIVKFGWWKDANMPKHFNHPKNSKEYCLALEQYGPSLIFIGDKLLEFEKTCLKKTLIYSFNKSFSTDVNLYIRN